MAVFTAIGAAVFGPGTFLAGVTAAGLQIAAGIAFSVLGKAMQGEPQPEKFGVQGTLQGGDDVPRSINFGWNCTAGSLVYHNTWGTGGVLSTRVIALGDMPIRELLSVEVNGVADTFGAAHPNYGRPLLGFRKGGKDHLWVKFYDGTQTVADPLLTGSVRSAARPYGATRVGRGVPYVIVTALAPENTGDKPLFQGLPTYKFITNGVRLYDPSKDDTVGGVGAQRWDDKATWGGDGDFLPPVQIYNLLRGIRVEGQWLYGMQATHPARVDNATFVAAINRARAVTPGTTDPTFRAGGEAQVGAPVHLTIEALVTACNGRLVEVGGTYKLYVGEPGEPVMAFTDGDILSTEEQTFSPFVSLADTINGVSATYPNPGEGWNTKTAPTLLRPDLEALDGNRRLLASVSLDFVPYALQVQQLMKWSLGAALRARRHTFVMGPEFRVIEPGDIVRWSSIRNGYIDKLFRVDGVVYKSNLDVIVDLTEVDSADYDWDQDEDYRPVIDGPLQLVGPAPMPMQGWQVFPAEIRDNGGVARRPSIEVWFASGVSTVERVQVQVRLVGELDPMFDGEIPYGDPWKTVLAGQFASDTDYQVRGRFIGPPEPEWSAWLGVTTPDIPDAVVTDIKVEQLGQELQNAHGLVTGDSAGSIQTQLAILDQRAEELALAVMDFNATAKETLNVLSVQNGGAAAGVIRNEKAIVEEGIARATAITELTASVGNFIAGGFLRFDVAVDELGSSANIMAKVQATAGADFSQAAWILKAEANGMGGTDAYFGVLGTFYVFDAVDGSPIPVFSATADGVEFENGTFAGVFKSKRTVGGVPIFMMDGNTGNWRFGAG